MATVNFLYRSKRPQSPLVLRLLYRYDGKDYVYGHKTRLIVEKNYWLKHHKKKLRDIDLLNEQNRINNELHEIESHVLKKFHDTDPIFICKDWLGEVLEEYYSPKEERKYPKDLIGYVEYYREVKKNKVTHSSLKKFGVTKNKLERFQISRGKIVRIKDVNLEFINEFENYCLSQKYAKKSNRKR